MPQTVKKSRSGKKILLGLAAAAAVLLVLLALAGNYLFGFALVPGTPGGMLDGTGSGDPRPEEAEDRWLTAGDEVELHALYLPNEAGGHRYAVVCHGYGSDPQNALSFSAPLRGMGFHILAPAARAHERSGGTCTGMGWPERRDIVAWVDTLVEQDPEADILLYGVSMGGATVMMTAGEADLSEHVKCVIEDCGYSSVWDEFAGQLEEMFGLPTFPLLDVASLVAQVRAGYGFREASAVEQLKKTALPVLFIHGEEDTFVPYWMLDVVYDACAGGDKERLSVPGAAHAEASRTDPALYWGTVEEFLERYVG